MNPTILKDPADLSIHHLAKLMPEWTKDDPRFHALVEDVREHGIRQVILTDREGRIVDGRSLWRVAKQLQIAEVETRVVADNQIVGTILGSLLQRKHFTKAQLAYLTFPLLQSGYEESKRRRLENLRNRQQSPETALSAGSGKTTREFAKQIGVCHRSFEQAAELHKHFENTRKFPWNDEANVLTLKEYYEPRILDPENPPGLGGVLAGIGAKLSPDTTNQVKHAQLELFVGVLTGSCKARIGYWSEFNSAQKTEGVKAIDELLAAMPADLLETFIDRAKLAKKKS